jgi:hypothetical protein
MIQKSDFLEKSDFSMLQKYFWEKSDFSMDKEIRFLGKIGFLNDLRNPIFWKNRISQCSRNPFGKIGFLNGKEIRFLGKIGFLNGQEIRFLGKIGFLNAPRNPIFWKNRISQ